MGQVVDCAGVKSINIGPHDSSEIGSGEFIEGNKEVDSITSYLLRCKASICIERQSILFLLSGCKDSINWNSCGFYLEGRHCCVHFLTGVHDAE